ncbi:MAG: malate dehydrogenase [Candidatus Omnitrophica bacterium]|nr:malate dehydrogenase [Candidatus Omnitrophota bacterium]
MFKKVSIIGAGAVGSTLTFHLFSRSHFKEIALVDIADGLAKGVSLDIEDSRSFFDSTAQIIGTDDFCAIADSDIVVVTAGVARKDGMTRHDLLKINAKVAKDISSHIKKHASKSILIVVTNPLDLITGIFAKETGFERNRVFGMGSSLDSARLLNILHQETKISTSVLEAFVFGLHNNDMIVSRDRMRVKGETINKFLDEEAIKRVQNKTAHRGGEIISFLKNRSANFAPSYSIFRLIEAISKNKNEIIPVCALLKGEYGLTDVCVGVPCIINSKGIEKVVELTLGEEEKIKLRKIQDSINEINNV